MNLRKNANAVIDAVINFAAFLACVLLICATLAVTTEVVTRNLFNWCTPGLMEVSGYALVYITFLATAYVLRSERHVTIDILVSRLRPRGQALVNTITSSICILVCLVIIYYGLKVTWEHFQIGYYIAQMIRFPSALILIIIPVGTFLLFIQFVRRTYAYLRQLRALPNSEQKS